MKLKLRTLHAQHRGVYGVNRPTVHMKLCYPQRGRRRIYRFMKELGIQGKTRRHVALRVISSVDLTQSRSSSENIEPNVDGVTT